MSDYQATILSGDSYKRGKKLTFFNLLDAIPTIQIEEEIVYNLNSESIQQPAGILTKQVVDFSPTFEIRDPITGLVTGTTAAYSDVYALLYSLYWHLALERDTLYGS
jgi:hypothetical protein